MVWPFGGRKNRSVSDEELFGQQQQPLREIERRVSVVSPGVCATTGLVTSIERSPDPASSEDATKATIIIELEGQQSFEFQKVLPSDVVSRYDGRVAVLFDPEDPSHNRVFKIEGQEMGLNCWLKYGETAEGQLDDLRI